MTTYLFSIYWSVF